VRLARLRSGADLIAVIQAARRPRTEQGGRRDIPGDGDVHRGNLLFTCDVPNLRDPFVGSESFYHRSHLRGRVSAHEVTSWKSTRPRRSSKQRRTPARSSPPRAPRRHPRNRRSNSKRCSLSPDACAPTGSQTSRTRPTADTSSSMEGLAATSPEQPAVREGPERLRPGTRVYRERGRPDPRKTVSFERSGWGAFEDTGAADVSYARENGPRELGCRRPGLAGRCEFLGYPFGLRAEADRDSCRDRREALWK